MRPSNNLLRSCGLVFLCVFFLLPVVGQVRAQVMVVNSTADLPDLNPGDGLCDTGRMVMRDGSEETECSLRAAIMEANALAGRDTIRFDIPTTDANYDPPTETWAIKPMGAGLPAIEDAVVIDGPTTTFVPALATATPTQAQTPVIVLDGSLADVGADGLVFGLSAPAPPASAPAQQDGSSHVMNLVVGQWLNGIVVERDSVHIRNCRIGVTSLGAPLPNRGSGVVINGTSGSMVGGPTDEPGTQLGNHIAGNVIGIEIKDIGASNNAVMGNVIGYVTPPSDPALANGTGVLISSARDNTIGGDSTQTRNYISGNTGDGVEIEGVSATGNRVIGNFIGTDVSGMESFGNGGSGVRVKNASASEVGGPTATPGDPPGNVIAGNNHGVVVEEQSSQVARRNRIEGNLIGTQAGADAVLPNSGDGIHIDGADTTTVGGDLLPSRNIIAGNDGDGIVITGSDVGGIKIQGNFIGTNGTVRMANRNGVRVNDVSGVLIGGATSAPGAPPGNVISGNRQTGVFIEGSLASQHIIIGNLIGLDSGGTDPLGECLQGGLQQIGVRIRDGFENRVGGAQVAERNVISANELIGVEISGSATNNNVFGNIIGLQASGLDYPSLACGDIGGEIGVFVGSKASLNHVGDLADQVGAPPGNVISGHRVRRATLTPVEDTGVGVLIEGGGNLVRGNLIGLGANGTERPFLNPQRNDDFSGNAAAGILVKGPSNTVGGGDTRARNIVSANRNNAADVTSAGIRLQDVFSQDNSVQGNFVGVDTSGASGLANEIGIELRRAFANRIGGLTTTPGDPPGNVISGNERGVLVIRSVPDASSFGNTVQGNLIGLDASGSLLQGTSFKGNQLFGVSIVNSTSHTIGGTDAGAGNVISGNQQDGVVIAGSKSRRNVIEANIVGTDPGRTQPLANGDDGVEIRNGASENMIGNGTAAAANFIAYHNDAGILLDQTGHNYVAGNRLQSNTVGIRLLGAEPALMNNHLQANSVAIAGDGSLVIEANQGTANGQSGAGIELGNANGSLRGNSLTNDLGDAIRLHSGANPRVQDNNIRDNQGLGLNNVDGTITVNAQGNWWGDASGPGGAGPGAGDEVSTGVDFANWQTAMVSLVVSAGLDTVRIPEGDSGVALAGFRNWLNTTESVDVGVTDDLGWVTSSTSFSLPLDADLGAGTVIQLDVPASAAPAIDGSVGRVSQTAQDVVRVTATSQTVPSTSVVDSFVVLPYLPVLNKVEILPDSARVAPGEAVQFVARGFDQFDREMDFAEVWSSTGGTVTAGRYVAGSVVGEFMVQVTDPATALRAQAYVKIEGAAPLQLALGILQNPYLTQFIDIYTVANQALAPGTMALQVGTESVPMTLVDATENVWRADYELQGGGLILIEVCATSALGSSTCKLISLTAQPVAPGQRVRLQSADRTFTVRISEGIVKEEGYILIVPSAVVASRENGLALSLPVRPLVTQEDNPVLSSFAVSPQRLLERGVVTVEFEYSTLDLPEGVELSQLYVEHVGSGPLVSYVDRGARVIRATGDELGEYRLRVGSRGVTRTADNHFLRLDQNYPNPFNPSTTIRFEVQTMQRVKIDVYDVKGRLVAKLLDGRLPAGVGQVEWDGTSHHGDAVASGVYFVRLQTEHRVATRKLILVK